MSRLIGAAPFSGATVQTTNATLTTIMQVDISAILGVPAINDAGVFVQGLLIGKSGNNVAQIVNCAAFKRLSGTLSMIGTLGSPIFSAQDVALATTALTLDNNGNNIRLRANGVAATTIIWTPYIWLYSGEF